MCVSIIAVVPSYLHYVLPTYNRPAHPPLPSGKCLSEPPEELPAQRGARPKHDQLETGASYGYVVGRPDCLCHVEEPFQPLYDILSFLYCLCAEHEDAVSIVGAKFSWDAEAQQRPTLDKYF